MTQEQIDNALDKPTFLDCFSTIRLWLQYQHSLGRKVIFYPDKNCADIFDENGDFYAFIVRHEYDYFCSLTKAISPPPQIFQESKVH